MRAAIRACLTGLVAAALMAASAGAVTVTIDAPGADDSLARQLGNASLSRQLQQEENTTAQDFVAAAQADYRRMLTALYDAGYYGPTVSILVDGREAAGLPPVGGPDRVDRIDIRVDTGPLFRFGRTAVGPVPEGTRMPEGFAPNEPAETGVIRDAVRTGVDAWRNAGYPRADVAEEDVTARHAESRLDVAVRLAPGRPLTFGRLEVSGNADVRTRRIREIAGLPTGEPYSPDAIRLATERLRRTGAFSTVVLRESEVDGPNDTLTVTAEVVEMVPRRIGFGIEVSSIDGLGVSAFWLHRNVFGGAERFRLDLSIDQIGLDGDRPDFELTGEFTRPGTFGLDRDLYVNFLLLDSVDELIDVRAAGMEVGLTERFGETLTVSAGFGLLYAEVITELEDEAYLLLTFPVSAEWDRRDNELNPKRGFYLDVEATPFLGLENAENGTRLYADTRAYYSFGAEDRVTVAGRLQFGTLTGATGADAPQDFLFLSGGGGTVRGQPYESLGVEVDGAEIGGNSFLGAQMEARVGITDAIEAVAFFDAGTVSTEAFPQDGDPAHSGAGLGLRYNTGIGPIRVDLATPTSGDRAGERLELYIGIGQAF